MAEVRGDKPDRSGRPVRFGEFSVTDVLMLGVVVVWGFNFSIIKGALAEMAPLAFNGLRFLLASVTMLILTRAMGGDLRVQRGDWPRLALVGLIGHTIYQILFIVGLNRTQAGHSSLMLGLTPVFVALIGLALGIERVRAWVWASILLSFAGVVLITSGSSNGLHLGGPTLVGDLLTLAATLCWASFTVLSKPLLSRYSPIKLITLTMLLGTVPFLALATPALVAQDYSRVTATGWLGLLYSYSLAIVAAYIVWYTSVQRVGNARTAIFSNLTPVVALIAAWLLRGETLAPLQFIGAAVVLLGISLARRR
ncbi:MAG: EamA family transporter [Chloroflexi bacterium]|nr:EamA family transporter [Chloroflexota bacterium]